MAIAILNEQPELLFEGGKLNLVNFMFFKKATKNDKIFTVDLMLTK